jgi:glycosyltransferase involved in cell wall biosynthesis
LYIKAKKILLFRDYYLPGYKSGGPIQTIANLVENLGDEFSFFIVTRDRDAGDSQPYTNIGLNDWNAVGKGHVFYISPGSHWGRVVAGLWRELMPDVVYLNSYFSPAFTILPLALRHLSLVPKCPVILAPRGEFHAGALAIKSKKKRAYRALADLIGFYKDVGWCATNENEVRFIRQAIGDELSVNIAPNLGALKPYSKDLVHSGKKVGKARFVVVARIAPIKNLHLSIKWLGQLQGDVEFDIYGPIADATYWTQCKTLLDNCPNLKATYKGAIPHQDVHKLLGEYDFFLSPSTSENYGHSIVEAMLAGCPPIISTGTPWTGLEERKLGWDVPLDQESQFISVLQQCIDMDNATYQDYSKATHSYAKAQICSKEAIDLNRRLLASI